MTVLPSDYLAPPTDGRQHWDDEPAVDANGNPTAPDQQEQNTASDDQETPRRAIEKKRSNRQHDEFG